MDRDVLTGRLVLAALALYIGYVFGRLTIGVWWPEEPRREILIDVWRTTFILLYTWRFLDWHAAAQRAGVFPRGPSPLVIVLIFTAAISSNTSGWESPYAWLYALTAIFPAALEEIFFRSILQRYLATRIGAGTAIWVASIVFALSHWGTGPLDLLRIVTLFSGGAVLGVIYARTGNLLLVIGVHAFVDVAAALWPTFLRIPGIWILVASLAASIGAGLWYDLDKRSHKMSAQRPA